ncbi:MAG: hypothetical protein HKN25_14405 [Pyrinomonadaceae bacterium]|nr:hypothetical protein [Pyrinomonadaceae bacterium]
METESISDNKIPQEKLYKDRQVWVASMLGGPLTAGYVIARNFKELGENKKVPLTLIIAVIVTIIVFSLAIVLPDGFPNIGLPLIYTLAAFALVRIYQGERLTEHARKGGLFQSWWKTIGVSMLGLALTIVLVVMPIFAFFYFSAPTEIVKTYGMTENEIGYQEGNVTEREVDLVAKALRETGFFDDEHKSYTYVLKKGNTYELFFNFNFAGQITSDTIDNYGEFRKQMQTFFQGKKIVVNLVVDDIANVIKRIE